MTHVVDDTFSAKPTRNDDDRLFKFRSRHPQKDAAADAGREARTAAVHRIHFPQAPARSTQFGRSR
jgi:hypothetical protein